MGDIFPAQQLPYVIGIWALGAVAGPISETFFTSHSSQHADHFPLLSLAGPVIVSRNLTVVGYAANQHTHRADSLPKPMVGGGPFTNLSGFPDLRSHSFLSSSRKHMAPPSCSSALDVCVSLPETQNSEVKARSTRHRRAAKRSCTRVLCGHLCSQSNRQYSSSIYTWAWLVRFFSPSFFLR